MLKTRVKILNALVRSRLKYTFAIWNLTTRQMEHMNAMLRNLAKGGHKRKDGTYHYVLRNEDILKRCNTMNIKEFVAKQQRNFIAHVIRGKDSRIMKRLLFNDDKTTKRGRQISLYQTVIENENITADVLNSNALSRQF